MELFHHCSARYYTNLEFSVFLVLWAQCLSEMCVCVLQFLRAVFLMGFASQN